jgi:hypothetical protein
LAKNKKTKVIKPKTLAMKGVSANGCGSWLSATSKPSNVSA